MSTFIDLSKHTAQLPDYDLIIVGSGAAGITIARELSKTGIDVLLLESGCLHETEEHETLNSVYATGSSADDNIQSARSIFHGSQLQHWKANNQQFGVRCRTLGGSTMGWAGKVALFDNIDYRERDWIEHSGWPISAGDLDEYVVRSAEYLDLGPLIQSKEFWNATATRPPEKIDGLEGISSFFWQFSRSRNDLTDVMRFGNDYKNENNPGITTLFNATAVDIEIKGDNTTGVTVCRTFEKEHKITINAPNVVLASGAIENARLLLTLENKLGKNIGSSSEAVGKYLMDHPSVPIGSFDKNHLNEIASLLGFFPLMRNQRVFMYSHGLVPDPELQELKGWPNMAVFMTMQLSEDDPLLALKRLSSRTSKNISADILSVLSNSSLVITSIGRKLLNYRKIPLFIRRLVADVAIRLNSNFVARDYQSKGGARKLDGVSLRIISEQPPCPENRIELSEKRDVHGIRIPEVHWTIDKNVRKSIAEFSSYLASEFERIGISGFNLNADIIKNEGRDLLIHDMAHTAGTTRMGDNPKTSVVDTDCRVHGVNGLYVAGASTFPTSGHANPTQMIIALAIRLSDKLKSDIETSRMKSLRSMATYENKGKPTILVTGATGNLGSSLIDLLVLNNYSVRGTYRSTIPKDPRVEWTRIDFSDPMITDANIRDLVAGTDVVINFAASLSNISEMQTANVTNLIRLASMAEANNVRYFGQASSIVVYGSPHAKLVNEECETLNSNIPLNKQYFAEPYMLEYARTKAEGEKALMNIKGNMHIDIYRISVAQQFSFMENSLHWGKLRRIFSLYRNSHFIHTNEATRAIYHLMKLGLTSQEGKLEIYNIADNESPTFAEFRKTRGMNASIHLPLVLDILKGFKIRRGLSLRRPMGAFKLDNRKLLSTGFDLDNSQNQYK